MLLIGYFSMARMINHLLKMTFYYTLIECHWKCASEGAIYINDATTHDTISYSTK